MFSNVLKIPNQQLILADQVSEICVSSILCLMQQKRWIMFESKLDTCVQSVIFYFLFDIADQLLIFTDQSKKLHTVYVRVVGGAKVFRKPSKH